MLSRYLPKVGYQTHHSQADADLLIFQTAVESGSQARLSQAKKLVLVSREPLVYFQFNKSNAISKTFMGSIHIIKSAFLSLKIIIDTLTDVGYAKYQNITS